MLFCSEFTSEEFSSPRTLWFSCLGVRELWMLRESSSLGAAFTGSSSLFWELGSSYPGERRRHRWRWKEESTVRTTTNYRMFTCNFEPARCKNCKNLFFIFKPPEETQSFRWVSSNATFIFVESHHINIGRFCTSQFKSFLAFNDRSGSNMSLMEGGK